MNEFGKYLKELREKRGLKMNQLAMYSGVSAALISRIESGERGVPKPDTIQKLADTLKVPYEELMRKAGHLDLPANAEPYDPERMTRIPLLGTIRAGEPIERIEHIEGYELVEPELLRGRKGFALKVQGDSMNGDRIHEGDVVIVVVQEEVTSSDIAIVAVNGEEGTLKRVKCQGEMCMLTPSNPTMEPLLVKLKDIHVIGKVIQVRRNL
jgi:repressor LexA